MTTKVQQWGNSLGVRIPKQVAEAAGLESGRSVTFSVSHGGVTIRPVSPEKMYVLKKLVAGITSANRHAEIDWGSPVGREVW